MRLSVLALGASPRTVTPSGPRAATRLTTIRVGSRGSVTAITSPRRRRRESTTSRRSPGCNPGRMLSPDTCTRRRGQCFTAHPAGYIYNMLISRLLTIIDRVSPPDVVHAHCDLPCGVYDPAQARIEAESVHKIQEKYQESDDEVFRDRAILIKEQRAELVKHHLWVLWTDYFKPEHAKKYPEIHDHFWQATKLAGE